MPMSAARQFPSVSSAEAARLPYWRSLDPSINHHSSGNTALRESGHGRFSRKDDYRQLQAPRIVEIEAVNALKTTPAEAFLVVLSNGYRKRGAFGLVPSAWRPVHWQRRPEAVASPRRKLNHQAQISVRASEARELPQGQRPRIQQPQPSSCARERVAVGDGDAELPIPLALPARIRATDCRRQRWRRFSWSGAPKSPAAEYCQY